MRSLCVALVGAVLTSLVVGCGSSEEAAAPATADQTANATKATELMKDSMLKQMRGKGGKASARR